MSGQAALRRDLALIAGMVPAGARVLDVGCGNGALLAHLAREKNVDGRGLELSQENVNACVARGLTVVQGDADTDLGSYPDAAFDMVILSQTVQATRRPARVLTEILRIGRAGIVSFPNFGYWRVRLSLALGGRMPVTATLPDPWHETANIHLCTVTDFMALTDEIGARIEEAWAVPPRGAPRAVAPRPGLFNLTAETAVFRLTR